jgi:hypothetical protein
MQARQSIFLEGLYFVDLVQAVIWPGTRAVNIFWRWRLD